jgi:lipoprotein-anchoring transpeptidase ErfK/SrfK
VLGLALTVGGSAGGSAAKVDATWRPSAPPAAAPSPSPESTPAGEPALALAPAAGAAGVSPADPVTVTATSATLDAVTLVDAQGRRVPGSFDVFHRTWRNDQPLAYNTHYTLTASATGVEGQHVAQSSAFGTVRPNNLVMPYLQANSGMLLADRDTYGVGQVVVVRFDEEIRDKAAAQRALTVITDPPVDGAWHWFGDQEAHWRPRAYWKPGTTVIVRADVYGRHLGNGLYGQADAVASFTIGPSRIAIADDVTHHILVYQDGRLIRDVPTAMGMHASTRGVHGEDIDFRTRSGVHVVLGNSYVVRMTSASFGVKTGPFAYDELVYWTTHVSYAGEYIHAAPWSVEQQGHSDASHGCLNVNTDNAIWFYNTFIPGDVLDVRNTGVALDPTDGLGDWNLSWDAWVGGSALPLPPPVHKRPPLS